MTAAFEILNIDLEKKRIGVALVPEGSARAEAAARPRTEIVPDAPEAEEVREYTGRAEPGRTEGFGSLAEKLRGALKPREK